MSTLCNIVRNNFNVCPLSAPLCATISTCVHSLQHCAQQFQCVSTLCNIVRSQRSRRLKNIGRCSCFLIFAYTARPKLHCAPATQATLCATISTCIHPLQHDQRSYHVGQISQSMPEGNLESNVRGMIAL